MHNFQLDTSLRKEHVRHKPETITGRLMTPILMQVWECPRGGPEPKESAQQSLDQRALAGTAGVPMGPYGAMYGPIWILLDRSGHGQIRTFGPIWYVSGPEMVC